MNKYEKLREVNQTQMFSPPALLFANMSPQSKKQKKTKQNKKKTKKKPKRNAIAVLAVIEGSPVIHKY